MSELLKTLDGLKSELKEWIIENPDEDEPNDKIFELADSGVPIDTYDLLQWALENSSFATDEPELGPAFDGTPTPTNIIAANIFEYLESELWEYWRDERDDILKELECAECGGAGEVEQKNGEWIICESCDGTGRIV